MDRTQFDILAGEESRRLVDAHISDDPAALALRLRNPVVTQQIRILQKCRTKLPTYYAARCIVPAVAYEQSSSERTAAARTEGMEGGELAVDLTCGLGVDALALSRKFRRVVTVEADPLRADMARYNFRLLGARNIEVITGTAGEFMAAWPEWLGTQRADLIYADPSRKAEDGRRVYSLEESSPDIVGLMPSLLQNADRIEVKLSPLFDVAEIFRIFGPDTTAEVVSLDGECKEVLVRKGFPEPDAAVTVTCIRGGDISRYPFPATERHIASGHSGNPGGDYPWIGVPDVGFYKARTVERYIEECYPGQLAAGDILTGDYLFCREPLAGFAGTFYRIVRRWPYHPKTVAKELKNRKIRRADLHRRNFPYTADRIARALGIVQGGPVDIFCTLCDGEPVLLLAERVR